MSAAAEDASHQDAHASDAGGAVEGGFQLQGCNPGLLGRSYNQW